MPKRFSDTDKWKKEWFLSLRVQDKALWEYLRDNCDHAGVWDVNLGLASALIKSKFELEEVLSSFEKQIVPFDGGKRWWIPSFIEFQYECLPEELDPRNSAHRGVLRVLHRYGLYKLQDWQEGALKGLQRGSTAPKDMVKDKDKDSDKAKDEKRPFPAPESLVKLKLSEVEALLKRLGSEERVLRAVDILENYLGESPRNLHRYSSHYRAILNWVVGELLTREKKGYYDGAKPRAGVEFVTLESTGDMLGFQSYLNTEAGMKGKFNLLRFGDAEPYSYRFNGSGMKKLWASYKHSH